METFGPVSPAFRVPALGEIWGVLGAVVGAEPLGVGAGVVGVEVGGVVGVGLVVGVSGVVEVGGAGVEGVTGSEGVGDVGEVLGGAVVLAGAPGVLGALETGVPGLLGRPLETGPFDGSPGAEVSGVPGADVLAPEVGVVPGAVLRPPGVVTGCPGFRPVCVSPPEVVASSGEVAGSLPAPGLAPVVEPSPEGALLRSVVTAEPLFPEAMSTADPGAPEDTACTSPSAPPPAASTAAIGTAARKAGRRGPRCRPPELPRSKGGRSSSSSSPPPKNPDPDPDEAAGMTVVSPPGR